jgi:hypothetical protein
MGKQSGGRWGTRSKRQNSSQAHKCSHGSGAHKAVVVIDSKGKKGVRGEETTHVLSCWRFFCWSFSYLSKLSGSSASALLECSSSALYCSSTSACPPLV